MEIKFLKNYKVKSSNGEFFEQGQVVKVSDRTANHFINKGVAVKHEPVPEKKDTLDDLLEDLE